MSNQLRAGKKRRVQYDSGQMADAVSIVRSGTMSKSEAARVFGVPRMTLVDKLSGKVPEEPTRPGPPCVLTKAEESALVDYSKLMASIGEITSIIIIFGYYIRSTFHIGRNLLT